MGALVQFPKTYNRSLFVGLIVLIYIIFCIPDSNGNYTEDMNFMQLMANRLTDKFGININYLTAVANYLLIGWFAFVGCVEIQNRLMKSIAFAVIWDTFFSLINLFIFGFEYNNTSNIIRNISVIACFVYAYLVLFGERKK